MMRINLEVQREVFDEMCKQYDVGTELFYDVTVEYSGTNIEGNLVIKSKDPKNYIKVLKNTINCLENISKDRA